LVERRYNRAEGTVFRRKKALTLANLWDVPNGSGVYIVYKSDGTPFYVGRSASSIHNRLVAHAQKYGSRKINEALSRGEQLDFEWEELGSPHQAEAQLIKQLGVITAGNLRRETDPADW
jgi:excinuclease UvrABC nuclease subunit